MKVGDLVKYRVDETWELVQPRMDKICGVILRFDINDQSFDDLYEAINSEAAEYEIIHVVVSWGDDGKKSWELEHEIEVVSESW